MANALIGQSSNSSLICLVCGKSYPQSELQGHVASIHLGFLPFGCTLCDFTAAQESEVLQHASEVGHLPQAVERWNAKPYLQCLTRQILRHCQVFADTKSFAEILSEFQSHVSADCNRSESGKSPVDASSFHPVQSDTSETSSGRSSTTPRPSLQFGVSLDEDGGQDVTDQLEFQPDDLPGADNYSTLHVAGSIGLQEPPKSPEAQGFAIPGDVVSALNLRTLTREVKLEVDDTVMQSMNTDSILAPNVVCTLCGDTSEAFVELQEREAHVLTHLEHDPMSSSDRSPAVFFAEFAAMSGRCFPPTSQQGPDEQVASAEEAEEAEMDAPVIEAKKGKKRGRPKSVVCCMRCHTNVKISAKMDHVWEKHLPEAERFVCSFCGSKGSTESALERSCCVAHPAIDFSIQLLAKPEQIYSREFELCFGSDAAITPQAQSDAPAVLPASPKSITATPNPVLLSGNLSSGGKRRYPKRSLTAKSLKLEVTAEEEKLLEQEVVEEEEKLASPSKSVVVRRSVKHISKNRDSKKQRCKVACRLCNRLVGMRHAAEHVRDRHMDGRMFYLCSVCSSKNTRLRTLRQLCQLKHPKIDAIIQAPPVEVNASFTARYQQCYGKNPMAAGRLSPGLAPQPSVLNVSAAAPASAEQVRKKRPKPQVPGERSPASAGKGVVETPAAAPKFRKKKRPKTLASGDKCQLCFVNVRRNSRAHKSHALIYHWNQPQKIFECSLCGSSANTERNIIVVHIKKRHSDSDKVAVIIDRRAKLADKVAECVASCFPKKLLRNPDPLIFDKVSGGASIDEDRPGTSGYTAACGASPAAAGSFLRESGAAAGFESSDEEEEMEEEMEDGEIIPPEEEATSDFDPNGIINGISMIKEELE